MFLKSFIKGKMIITVILHQNQLTLKQVLRHIGQFSIHFKEGKNTTNSSVTA